MSKLQEILVSLVHNWRQSILEYFCPPEATLINFDLTNPSRRQLFHLSPPFPIPPSLHAKYKTD